MRIQVNLATRPFVELRPFFQRLRITMAVLVLAGLALAIGAHLLAARAATQQAELDGLREKTIAFQQAKLRTEQRMREAPNARVLDRAHFLNTLFLKKSFSWTAVMMDLENVLPNGVQVTSLEPQVAPDGNVIIRLRVAGERANAVQLVRNLERSRRFRQPRLSGETSQAKENAGAGARSGFNAPGGLPTAPPGVEFDILANYNPLPPGEPYAVGHGRPVKTSSAARPSAAAAYPMEASFPLNGAQLEPYHGPIAAAAEGSTP